MSCWNNQFVTLCDRPKGVCVITPQGWVPLTDLDLDDLRIVKEHCAQPAIEPFPFEQALQKAIARASAAA